MFRSYPAVAIVGRIQQKIDSSHMDFGLCAIKQQRQRS